MDQGQQSFPVVTTNDILAIAASSLHTATTSQNQKAITIPALGYTTIQIPDGFTTTAPVSTTAMSSFLSTVRPTMTTASGIPVPTQVMTRGLPTLQTSDFQVMVTAAPPTMVTANTHRSLPSAINTCGQPTMVTNSMATNTTLPTVVSSGIQTSSQAVAGGPGIALVNADALSGFHTVNLSDYWKHHQGTIIHSWQEPTISIKIKQEGSDSNLQHSIFQPQQDGTIAIKLKQEEPSDDKSLSCSQCNFKAKESSKLRRHELTHSGEKPYACRICNFRCKDNSKLKRHSLIHTGEKPFPCHICEFRCRESSKLKTHMLIHTGENPYECLECDFKCKESSKLKRHMLTHTGEKPFACTQCDYRCKDNSKLKRHMLTHTGEKPVACIHCDFRCREKSKLKIHMRHHHGNLST
ncbi:unnamed protein product [Meganyctiphanes norvegica]|uniref:C2H2-type domain-containing protein n=1 Tax=Meganyctiphanes norvegica TaxID=48144 RepID=A0AAV2RX58_MEGNR